MIAARDVGAEKRARSGGSIAESPACVGGCRPGEDVVVPKRAELADEFKIPIERFLLSKQPSAERVAKFIRCAAREFCILSRKAQVIKICLESWDEMNRPTG